MAKKDLRAHLLRVIDTKGHPVRRMVKDAVLAISLANLCLIGAWRRLLYNPDVMFFLTDLPRWQDYAAALCDTLLLAALFFFAATLLRKWQAGRFLPWARVAFLLFFLFALNETRLMLLGPARWNLPERMGTTAFFALLALAGGLLVFALARWSDRFIRLASMTVGVLAPFALINLAQASWLLVQTSCVIASVAGPAKATGGAPLASRVVWIIFDEMDYRAAFGERLPSVTLPEFDRLRGQSLFATDAWPPAGATIYSLPSLIAGKTVSVVKKTSPSELTLTFAGTNERVRWSTQPSIFSRARSYGGRTALVGWHIPYGRMIGNDLDKCSWYTPTVAAHNFNLTFGGSMLGIIWEIGKHIPLLRTALNKYAPPPAEESNLRVLSLELWRRIQRDAIAVATDPNLSLTLIHHWAPHLPGIFDRRKKEFSVTGGNYFDNLVLADRTLGELRRNMEQAGLWDKTTVLVSSDHRFRPHLFQKDPMFTAEEASFAAGKPDNRVPFILKLAGTSAGAVYTNRFNTIITHDLLLAILHGDIRSMEELVRWIDRHKTDPPAIYVFDGV